VRRVLLPLLIASALLVGCASAPAPVAGPPPSTPAPASPVSARPREARLLRELRADPPSYSAVPKARRIAMWERAGSWGSGFTFDARGPRGGIPPLLVESARRVAGELWLRVALPIRPNGSTAWVRASDVRLRPERERIEVDLSRRVLERYRDGELVQRLRVGIGAPGTPTPTGTFFVWVKVPFRDPAGPYGIYALGLSGFSEVLRDWPGGGRMAIHGTADPSDRGRAVSHGCVRVWNPDMATLTDVPLGTPVIIHR
jgi:lipoprotein-anchoring transpeptidase ErfK/SrfK